MKHASLKSKLLALCAALAVTTSVVGGLSYLITHDITANYRYVADVTLKKNEALEHMNGAFKEIRIALRTVGIEGIEASDSQRALEDAKKWIAAYEEHSKQYEAIPFASGETEAYQPLQEAWAEFKGVGARILTIAATDTVESQASLRGIFLKDCPEAAARFRTAMTGLLAFQEQHAQDRVQNATVTAERGNFTMTLVSILVPIVGLFFGVLFSNRLARVLKRLADGLARGAGEVNQAAEQISAAGEAISASSTQQASALQETVASLDEVSAMVNRNAENATRSREASLQGREAGLRGKDSMNDMRVAIADISASNDAIKHQIEASHQEIANIVTIIAEIGHKTRIINDIVFQTKLLSFNASVEAARAGEHGKGFAVVAEEVGNLAQMSGNAAREISQLLEASIQKVEETVQATKARVEALMVQGHDKVQAGTIIAERCGAALDEIVQSVEGLTQMVTEIATASGEQAQGVEQINTAMGHLDQVAQQNVAASEQAAGAAAHLNDQAASLRAIVMELVRTVDGGATTPSALEAPSGGQPPARALKRGAQVIPMKKRAA